jgi:hypothetical protein
MLAWSPAKDHRYALLHKFHTAEEQDNYTVDRYKDIINDLVAVAEDPNEEPLVAGSQERVRSGVLALAIASYESGGYREDVDQIAPTGDYRNSYCLMQVQVRPGEKMKSRQDCFRLGFARVRESQSACKSHPIDERLAVYASGRCDAGRANSRLKMKRANDWTNAHPFFSAIEETFADN